MTAARRRLLYARQWRARRAHANPVRASGDERTGAQRALERGDLARGGHARAPALHRVEAPHCAHHCGGGVARTSRVGRSLHQSQSTEQTTAARPS